MNEKGLILRYNALDVKEYQPRYFKLFQGLCCPSERRIFMNTLNQIIIEGKLELYDEGWDEEMLIVSYLIGDYRYATKLDVSSKLLPKYMKLIGRTVRIVGKLAGDEIVVEHVDTID